VGRYLFTSVSVALAVAVVAGVGPLATAAGAATPCDPIQTAPHFRGEVPSPEQVLGYPIGSRESTAADIATYVAAVDARSPRVVSGQFATSWEGRPLKYAIVGRRENVTPAGLAKVRANVAALRDPATSANEAGRLAASSPAILWLAGNVHGGEESGADADLRILYELADRDDCAAQQILDNAVVVIAPTQNPDGREAETRRNHYDFDLNRDWFARTQPETDGKLELLRQYPPALFIDAHEMGGQHYFFPPNKDPIYHEVADTVIDWQDQLYGPAIQAEFDRQHIQYFNDDLYDFFALVYGDTVPAVGFGGNGMTFEKYNAAPIAERTYEHYVSQWVSLSTGALHRESILRQWHEEYVEAYLEGVNGELEPNFVNDKGSRLLFQVPTDRVRHYFLVDDPAKRPELQALVRRLQRMEVSVYRLTEPLAVPDYKPYGRSARPVTLPAGTYWIPMAQQQKHWVQGMLNEDTYVAFPYFYDISGWSNPLLFNVRGGRSGAVLSPPAEAVAPQAEPGPPTPSGEVPRIAVLRTSGSTSALESAGWLSYLFEQVWHLPYTRVTAGEIAAGALADYDVLIATQGDPGVASNALGPDGRQALAAWLNAGGRYIGWGGGAVLAGRLGLTSDMFADPHSDVAGALIRVNADTASPLASGVGDEAFVFYEYDPVIRAADPRYVAAWFPAAGSPDFYVSGFAAGEEELGGTAAITDEPAGDGRIVLFASEPNFRAYTTGMQKVLWNALFGANPWRGGAARAAASASATSDRTAVTAARAVKTAGFAGIRLTVRRASVARTRQLLSRLDATYRVLRSRRKVSFLVTNPAGAESRLAVRLGAAVQRSRIVVVALVVP
jgi:Zinc carboxypeptidase